MEEPEWQTLYRFIKKKWVDNSLPLNQAGIYSMKSIQQCTQIIIHSLSFDPKYQMKHDSNGGSNGHGD